MLPSIGGEGKKERTKRKEKVKGKKGYKQESLAARRKVLFEVVGKKTQARRRKRSIGLKDCGGKNDQLPPGEIHAIGLLKGGGKGCGKDRKKKEILRRETKPSISQEDLNPSPLVGGLISRDWGN